MTLWGCWHARIVWGNCFLWQRMVKNVTPSFGLLHFHTARFKETSGWNPRTPAHRLEQSEVTLNKCFQWLQKYVYFSRRCPGEHFLCTNGTGSHQRAPGLDSDAGDIRGDFSHQVFDASVKPDVEEIKKKQNHIKHTAPFPLFGLVFGIKPFDSGASNMCWKISPPQRR